MDGLGRVGTSSFNSITEIIIKFIYHFEIWQLNSQKDGKKYLSHLVQFTVMVFYLCVRFYRWSYNFLSVLLRKNII